MRRQHGRTAGSAARGLRLAAGAALFGLAAPCLLRAQKKEPAHAAAEAELQVGFAHVQVDALSSALEARGFPPISRNVLTTGAGTHVFLKHMIFGGSVFALLSRTTQNAAYWSKVSGGHGELDVGFVLVGSPSFSVSPNVGFGAGKLTTRLRDLSAPTFNETLADPRRGVEMTAHSYNYDVGLTLEHALQIGASSKGFTLGLHVGTLGRLGDAHWNSGPARVPGAPYASVGGPYARLTFGRPVANKTMAALSSLVSVLPWLKR